jgi:hypothetical protein
MSQITIEQQIEELIAAGWKRTRVPSIWKSPKGALFLGPHGAWKVMRGIGNFTPDGRRNA